MQDLKMPEDLKKKVSEFVEGLKQLYPNDLVSVVLYGSAVSGELVESRSNINLLVVLKNTDLPALEVSRKLVNTFSNRNIEPLFLSHVYLSDFNDVFPIEFLDMKENYRCLFGHDVLKDMNIDLKHLSFQCEHELKSKLILLKQQYLRINPNDKRALSNLLFKNLTSVLHILRNLIRLKGKKPSYNKEDVLKETASELQMEITTFFKILEAKKNTAGLKASDLRTLLSDFTLELDKIAKMADKL